MTKQEVKILQYLTDYNISIFCKDELKENVDFTPKELDFTLRSLVHKDKIISLEKGKYCLYGFADANIIGTFLTSNSCLSYWTAINYYGLSEQIPNVVFVQTDRQKTSKEILGVSYRFVWLKTRKIFGYKTEGYGNHSFRIADIEKTIIDSFDLPHYSGGYPEIIKAFYKAKINETRLISYCKKFNNISITKRLAFLADLFKKEKLEAFMDYAQKIKNGKYNLFEHNGEPTGKINKKWGLIMNITEEEIINMATV